MLVEDGTAGALKPETIAQDPQIVVGKVKRYVVQASTGLERAVQTTAELKRQVEELNSQKAFLEHEVDALTEERRASCGSKNPSTTPASSLRRCVGSPDPSQGTAPTAQSPPSMPSPIRKVKGVSVSLTPPKAAAVGIGEAN